ncbi:MAG: RecX family transcriptional regulator, partial [Anaerolineales bacterium]|nr:RecX family transcriptional regulator [Anaerolineales bacterium]
MKSGRIDRANEPREQSNSWVPLALDYLAVRDRTSSQIRHFLSSKGASPHQIEQVLRKLARHGYVDDRAYAERWVASRV